MQGLKDYTLIILLGLVLITPAQAVQFFHDEPAPVIIGEALHLELTYSENKQPVSNVFFFYRMQGEHNYRSLRMRQEGLILTVDMNTSKFFPGDLEYYFAYQDAYGDVKYLPAGNPEDNPFRVKILPAKSEMPSAGGKLFIPLLLSPAPGEVVPPDELLLAFSIPFELDPEKLTYKLFIGGVDVSKLLQRDGNLLAFSPKSIRGGLHNVELKILNENGKLIGRNQLSFRISGKPSKQKAFESSARIFLDNRYQNIQKTSENYFRGGAYFTGSYKQLEFKAHALISSEEAYNLQPINQYSIQARYLFNERNSIYLKGGDFTTNYDPLSFWEKRIRGIGAGFYTRFFDFDYSYGQNFRAVEGKIDTAGVIRNGTYQQNFTSFRPQINFGRHFSWAFDLVNAKDDPKSIVDSLAGNPKEALVAGSSINLNLDKKRILLKGSFQASIKNEDAGGEAVEFDSIAASYELSDKEIDQIKPFVNLMEKTGFLTLTQGLTPIPSFAMHFETQLRYFGHSFKAAYKRIDAEFTSPGNPYLRRDIAGYFISDNVRMLQNQVLLNLYFNSYADNLSQGDAKTQNQAMGTSISYFPFSSLPSITLSYGNQSRKNNLARQQIDPDSTILTIVDNRHQRFGISSSYRFNTGKIHNTLMLNASKFQYADAVSSKRNTDLILFSIGMRSRFSFPLTARFNYAQDVSNLYVLNANDLTYAGNEVRTRKFQAGLDYNIRHFAGKNDLKPFLNISLQNIANNQETADYNRQNYSAGFYLRGSSLGNLSFRYDYINYGSLNDWKDTIISTRYDISF